MALVSRRRPRRRAPFIAWALGVALVATLAPSGCATSADRSIGDYATCESDNECQLGSNCFTVPNVVGDVQAPMCSRSCLNDADCTRGGACVGALTSGVGICYERCPPSGKCTAGFACETTDSPGSMASICTPH